MFVNKGKINTSRFFSYAASRGISRKTWIWQPPPLHPISRQTPTPLIFLYPLPPPPFLAKIFRPPPFPLILEKSTPPLWKKGFKLWWWYHRHLERSAPWSPLQEVYLMSKFGDWISSRSGDIFNFTLKIVIPSNTIMQLYQSAYNQKLFFIIYHKHIHV